MPGPIQLELDELGHDVTGQLKSGISDALDNGGLRSGEGVIEADELLAGLDQPIPHDPSIQASRMDPAASTVLVWALNNQAGRAALPPQKEAKPAQSSNINPEVTHLR